MSFAATRSETFKRIPRALKEKRWGDWFKTEKIGLEKVSTLVILLFLIGLQCLRTGKGMI